MRDKLYKTSGFNPEEDDTDPFITDSYIDEPGDIVTELTPKNTVVLSIYSKKGLEDVVEGFEEVVAALDKWAKKYIK